MSRPRLLLAASASIAVLAVAGLVLFMSMQRPLLAPPRPAPPSEAPPRQPATAAREMDVYSDLCSHAGTGEVDGLRIFVRAGGGEPRVQGQYAADGRLPPPRAASSTEAHGRITFQLPGASGPGFTGVIEHGRATVRSNAPRAEPFELARSDASNDFPLCG